MLVWSRAFDLFSVHPDENQVEATGKTKFIYNYVNPVHVAEPAVEPDLKQQVSVNQPQQGPCRAKRISTNGSNRPNSQTWHSLANGGIGGESEVQ